MPEELDWHRSEEERKSAEQTSALQEENAKNQELNRKQRKVIVLFSTGYLISYFIVVVCVIILQGFGLFSFHLPESVLITLVAGMPVFIVAVPLFTIMKGVA